MRIIMVMVSGALALVGCADGAGNEAQAAHNDVATAARLFGADLNAQTDPSERATRLAECSAVLTSHIEGTPPPEFPDSMRQTASRLLSAAIALAEANGRTAAEINRIREQALAAHRQLAANNADAYRSAMVPAIDKCSLAQVMTEDELAGRRPGLPGNDLGPMPLGNDLGAMPTN